jgi:hypothetical protein
MSVCLHDPNCPGHGFAHEAAMRRAGTPPVDLSPLANKIPLPGHIDIGLTEDEKILSPSTKMLLVMAAKGQRIYEGTVPGHVKARRRAKNRRARRARVVHRGCTK